jgi:hypothetical protein
MKAVQKLNRKIADMSDPLIQNETAATELFQTDSSEPAMRPSKIEIVKEENAGLIYKNSTLMSAFFTQTEIIMQTRRRPI